MSDLQARACIVIGCAVAQHDAVIDISRRLNREGLKSVTASTGVTSGVTRHARSQARGSVHGATTSAQ